ncbi:Variant-specific surface protein [Giardia duodenalis]|uniref:Variant-specific surface protein n=1 Tax=Giardia intestinalis TaxID=5741 RepID=V6TN57_GIAIN|nr:Variant-specific surface protein [Giardia intestinalis]
MEYTKAVRAERAGAEEAERSGERRGPQDPVSACTAEPSGSGGSCNTCGATIGQTTYCSKCNEPDTYAPVDGVCVDAGATPYSSLCTAHADGACTECGSTSFLYKGGCYQPGDGKPGQSLCVLAAGGVCTEAATGYFVPTGAVNTGQSVVKCDDVNKVTVGGTTYKGVAGCQECAAPAAAPSARAEKVATCTRCQEQKYLKGNACVDSADDCGEGYAAKEDSENGNRCIKCDDPTDGIADCAQCTAITSLTRAGTPLVTCSQCSTNKKVRPDKKGCADTCPTNSSDNNGVCECASGYTPDETGCTKDTTPQCTTPGCKACDNPAEDSEVCTECVENKYLTPTSQCIADCAALSGYYGATENEKKVCKRCEVANCEACNAQGQCQTCTTGFYLDSKECKACDSSCKSCSGATNADCTACPSGKALTYGSGDTKGTCGEGCTTGTGQGACKTCGLTVEGTAYCSACATSTEYPQNGVCSSTTARTAATCKTNSVSNGACTSCNDGFFLMEGGCYETSKYPGKSVCTKAAQTGGTCQTAAPGYKVENGNLVTCSEGCKTCSDASTCTACADGYVLTSSTCTKCDASCLTCETDATKCTECASG